MAGGRRLGRRLASALAVPVALAVGLVVACGSSTPPTDPPPPTLPAVLTFRCGDVAMTMDALANPFGAEDADEPAARALRAFLHRIREPGESVPEPASRTYRVLHASVDAVLFGSDAADGPGFHLFLAERAGDTWAVHGAGACEPQLDLPGLRAASWHLPAGVAPPGRDVARITAVVADPFCLGGESLRGRIVPPAIVRRPAELLVVFGVTAPPGGTGVEACAGELEIPVEVDLGGPLEARELLDGRPYPPVPVWHPDCCG